MLLKGLVLILSGIILDAQSEGLILPQASGILPILSPIAAVGLAVIMILAASYHIPRQQYKEVMFNTSLFVLSLIVVFYRF